MDDDGNECDAQEKGADENMDDDVQNAFRIFTTLII
ncbi:unnamed protein product [Brassica oleracea var. botrytis]